MEGRKMMVNDKSVYEGPKYPTKACGSIPAFNSYEDEAKVSNIKHT